MSTVALRELEPGRGVLIDAFDEQALAIAAMAASPNTRRAYATAYRAFADFLRARYGEASKQTVTIASVAAWRDDLAARGLAPNSVTQRVSAVRRLAATLGADPLVQQVRCTQVQRDEPRALSDAELDRLLRQPDRRTVIGIRDRAILELLARAGLRRTELARLTVNDIQEGGRQPDARRRTAIAPGRAEQTRLEAWYAPPSAAARERCRCTAEAHDALSRWYTSRPTSESDALFVSLRQRRSARSGGDLGGRGRRRRRQARRRRGVREDRQTAHALRHTFCTMRAERDVALEVIRELAGHVDVRTTQIYVDVSDQRKDDGIAALERAPHPLLG